jgi:hypothetical protein
MGMAHEYTIETRVVTGPSHGEGTSAEYIVAWTVGRALAEPAIRPST